MTVKDIIEVNDKDIEIIIKGRNALDDCDCFVEYYYEGKLGDVPEKYYDITVLYHSFSVEFLCPCICIPYLFQNDLVDPEEFEDSSSLLETADQGEPEDVEASEPDNTVENRTCETCLYRDYEEPDRCDETFHFTCRCCSSPFFEKVSCSDTCDFYIPEEMYRSLLSSAPSG